MTPQEAVQLLKQHIKIKFGGNKSEFARHAGVSPQYLHRMMSNPEKNNLTESIQDELNIEMVKTTEYVAKKKESNNE